MATQRRGPAHDQQASTLDGSPAWAPRAALRTPGQSLEATFRERAEGFHGVDLGDVRVHEGGTAAGAAAALGAVAFTVGSHVVLGGTAGAPAASRELVLAHEIAHVVQQRSGRATAPTAPLSHPDDRWERDADRRAAALVAGEWRRVPPASGRPGAASSPVVQRKVTTVGAVTPAPVIASRLRIFARNTGLPELERRDVVYAWGRLLLSPLDYGTIDFTDEQHLGFLYFYVRKQALRLREPEERTTLTEKREQPEHAVEAQEAKAAAAEDEWLATVANQPADATRTVKIAFIGAGASIAYYLATLSENLDPAGAIIIGSTQPWAGERGPGVLGHPEHMVTPMLRFAGLTDVGEKWLSRTRFTALIDAVFAHSGIERVRRRATAITRAEKGLYRIELADDTVYYAQRVVVGAGAGGHVPPGGVDERAIARAAEQLGNRRNDVSPRAATGIAADANATSDPGPTRLMDIDLFTNVAPNLVKGPDGVVRADPERGAGTDKHNIRVVLSGGNAGIDAAFDALYRGYRVEWIVGSGPPKFLSGFFNYAAYLGYLRTVAAAPDDRRRRFGFASKEAVEQEIQRVSAGIEPLYADQNPLFRQVVARFVDDQTTKFEGVYLGHVDRLVSDDNGVIAVLKDGTEVKGDILVYAQGQDNKTFRLLANVLDDLVPQRDINARFGRTELGATAATGLATRDKGVEVIGATAFRLAPKVAPDDPGYLRAIIAGLRAARAAVRDPGATALDEAARAVEARLEPLLAATANNNRPSLQNELRELEAAARQYDDARRVYRAASPEAQQAVAQLTTVITAARAPTQALMAPVISSLPGNVLVNDQLTATRSQIVASRGHLPYDIARHADFVVDDQTALAVHITARYPRIGRDAALVEKLVARIVANRRQEAYPIVPPKQERFQKAWENTLGDLDASLRRADAAPRAGPTA